MTLWYEQQNLASGFAANRRMRRINLDLEPAPTLMADGVGGDCHSHYDVYDDGVDVTRDRGDKPPYAVPTMAEIAELPWNGMRVASTFAGCGGSCIGYRMAGFRIAWANEIARWPAESYRRNFPDARLAECSIRDLDLERELERMGLARGELDVLDGSPPCTPFSTAGLRHKKWRELVEHAGTSQRVDDLFLDYVKVLDAWQPRAFVAENVSGLVKGAAKGYFNLIFRAMRECGYRVEAQLLDAQWLGVPQTRKRIIFVGIRADLETNPPFPEPLKYRYSVRDAIDLIPPEQLPRGDGRRRSMAELAKEPPVEGDISAYAIGEEWERLRPGDQSEKYFDMIKADPARPSPTVTAAVPTGQDASPVGAATVVHPYEKRKFTIAELKRICSFPDDFDVAGSYGQAWAQFGNSVPPLMMRAVAEGLSAALAPAPTHA